MENKKDVEKHNHESNRLTFWQSFTSVFWAAFGVQRHAIWKRDMQQGSILGFGLAIVVFLALFIGILLAIVSAVIQV